MSESICHGCVFRVSKSPDEARCKRYPGASIEGMERCVGFRSLDSLEPNQRQVDIEQFPIPGPSVRDLIVSECNALCMMLVRKNDKYGNSALDPVRVFSKADPLEQIRVRLDDKLSRIMRGQGIEDEDVVKDLMGYLVLLRVAKRMQREGGA